MAPILLTMISTTMASVQFFISRINEFTWRAFHVNFGWQTKRTEEFHFSISRIFVVRWQSRILRSMTRKYRTCLSNHSKRRSCDDVDPTRKSWRRHVINYTACRVSFEWRSVQGVYQDERTWEKELRRKRKRVNSSDKNDRKCEKRETNVWILFSFIPVNGFKIECKARPLCLCIFQSHRWSNDEKVNEWRTAKETRSQSGRFHAAIKQSALVQWDN